MEPVTTELEPESGEEKPIEPGREEELTELNILGNIPPELWNRLGTKILPKLPWSDTLEVGVGFKVRLPRGVAGSLRTEVQQILNDLGLDNCVRIE